MANKLLPGQRCDGYEGEPTNPGNPIREKWIHKQIVVKNGEGEDDFAIEEKAVCVEKANIQKEIEEQAKQAANIKKLIEMVNDSGGDESCLKIVEGTYGDVSDMPTDLHTAISIVQNAKAKGLNLEDDKILTMSKAEINKMINDAVNAYAYAQKQKQQEQPKQQEDNGGAQ